MTTQSGVFLDSPVAGLAYTSGSRSGTTGADGGFTCEVGETVTFSIGSLRFPPVACTTSTEVVTPLTVFNTTDMNDPSAVNLARLLQTLDDDGNPDNGINIAPEVHALAAALPADLDFADSGAFESAVADLIDEASGAGHITKTSLVSEAEAKSHLQAQLTSIAGAWAATVGSSHILITFHADGRYVHVEDGTDDPNGQNGMERGTYAWDPETGAFTSACPAVDTNGQWGLSHSNPDAGCSGTEATVTVSGNRLVFDFGGGETFELTRVVDATNPMVGSWWFTEGPTTMVITFFADGRYVHAEDGTDDPNGENGMERGTYTWNPSNGDFVSACPVVDTNREWGLSSQNPEVECSGTTGTVTVVGNTLTFDAGDDVVDLARVKP